jgi:hypothetical protein
MEAKEELQVLERRQRYFVQKMMASSGQGSDDELAECQGGRMSRRWSRYER